MNPIARMMKRYIKTPLKYALPLLFIGALVFVSISGCVSTPTTSPSPTAQQTQVTTTPTSQASPTAASSSSDQSSYITSQFSSDYIIVTPFTKSINSYGNVVYTGVVKDSPTKKLDPYSHKITIELTKDNDTTKTRYAQYKTQLLSSGLVTEFDYGNYMTFYDGSTYTNPPREAYLEMNEPGLLNHVYNTGVFLSLGNTFLVTLDDTTKL
jgi:hypothetical protein